MAESVEVSVPASPPAPPVVAVVESPPSADMLRLAEQAGQQTAELERMRAENANLSAQVAELTQRQAAAEETARAAAVAAAAAIEATVIEESELEGTEVTEVEVPAVLDDQGEPATVSPGNERGLIARMFLGRLPSRT